MADLNDPDTASELTPSQVVTLVEPYIALVCPVKDCRVAIVSPRELSRVAGTITDPPTATSAWQGCPKHSQEGEYPVYFDYYGNEVSGDPETFTEVTTAASPDPNTTTEPEKNAPEPTN